MYNRRSTGSSQPVQPWQAAVLSDRGGEGSSSARPRALPSHSLAPRSPAPGAPAARPSVSSPSVSRLPASHPFAASLRASNPFASRLPASNPFAPRVSNSIASRLLSAPRDGESESSESSSWDDAKQKQLEAEWAILFPNLPYPDYDDSSGSTPSSFSFN